jgi:DUF917 family protein
VRLTAGEMTDLARGAAFLGTGGGGDPYVGRLVAEQALVRSGGVELLPLDQVPDDALVIAAGNMGAPTVLVEKLLSGAESADAVRRLEAHLGRKATAIIPFEAGGVNSTLPVLIAAEMGLPVVDADGMGRAFPELQMETFGVYGVRASPMAIANEHRETVIVEAHSNHMVEWIARSVAIRMGGQCAVASYAMDGRTARRVSVPGTMSLCLQIGRIIREARETHSDPFAALIAFFPTTHYRHARLIFRGKVADVDRRTERGFALAHVRIEGLDDWAGTMELEVQNENLVARVAGQLRAIVPDLICVLDTESAEPITTERLRYGQRVTVMAVAVPSIMCTPEALAVFGPAAFGLNETYQPLEAMPG